MPTIHMVDSIKIDVYGRDHPPPHFHAVYAGQEALVEIKTMEIYSITKQIPIFVTHF